MCAHQHDSRHKTHPTHTLFLTRPDPALVFPPPPSPPIGDLIIPPGFDALLSVSLIYAESDGEPALVQVTVNTLAEITLFQFQVIDTLVR